MDPSHRPPLTARPRTYSTPGGKNPQTDEPPAAAGLADVPTRLAILSLQSALCPACGRSKVPGRSLCPADYFRLPKFERTALYAGVNAGYCGAVARALRYLNVASPHWPKE